jgi:general secretion pathway protein J
MVIAAMRVEFNPYGATPFEPQYLNSNLAWVDAWPGSAADPPIPQAVRLRLVLVSGEELEPVFGLRS